jgi:hypothetical protein
MDEHLFGRNSLAVLRSVALELKTPSFVPHEPTQPGPTSRPEKAFAQSTGRFIFLSSAL